MGIQQKIIIPFALLIIAAVFITGALAVRLNSARVLRQAQEQENLDRMRDEMKRVQDILAFPVPLTNEFLKEIKPLFEGRIVLTDTQNKVTLTSTDEKERDSFRAILKPPAETDKQRPVITRKTVGGRDYYVVADSLRRTGGYVYLIFSAEKLAPPPEAPVTAISLIAAGALIAVFGLGVFIARTITRPIKELARRSAEIAGGNLDRPLAPTGRDETAALAASFNHMLAGLKNYQEKLIASEKLAALGQVTAGIAHEIRNPLNSISMNAQMMEKTGAIDREALRIIKNEIQRLRLVVDELLDFARSPVSEKSLCDLNALFDEVLDLMQMQLEHVGVAVRRNYAAGAVASVDANRLKQVAMNLIINGMQAMPSGGTISVTTELRGAKVRCYVADTGEGIPPENRDKVFRPFFSTRAEGSGLGLAICKKIIDECGGEIGFETGEAGTTFWFELPR